MIAIYATVLLVFVSIDSSCAVCQNLPPGIDRIVRGLDVTQLDFLPEELVGSNGFNHPVIEFTCATGRKWTNPMDPSVHYDVPDQVEAINPVPGSYIDVKTHFYSSHSEVKSEMSKKRGFNLGFFSLSRSYKKVQQTIIDNLNAVVEANAFVSAFEVVMKKDAELKLDSNVQELLNQLPPTYQQNPTLYQEFISYFGTHFLQSGFFGGYLTTKSEVTESYVKKVSVNEVSRQGGLNFFGIVKLKGGNSKVNDKVSDEFIKSSHTHEAFYGGNTNLLSSQVPNFTQWISSVPKNPWLYEGQLAPLTNLISAGPKRDAIALATTITLDKAYLTDLSRSLELLLNTFYMKNTAPERTQSTNYLNQVNALKSQPIPNHSQVTSLGQVVDAFIIAERNKAALKCTQDKRFCNSDLIH